MRIFLMGAFAALAATAAQAGDQPVIVKPWIMYDGGRPVVYNKNHTGTPTIQYVYTMRDLTVPVASLPASGAVTATTVKASAPGSVRTIGLSQQSSDALYAQLLSEAKARGLR